MNSLSNDLSLNGFHCQCDLLQRRGHRGNHNEDVEPIFVVEPDPHPIPNPTRTTLPCTACGAPSTMRFIKPEPTCRPPRVRRSSCSPSFVASLTLRQSLILSRTSTRQHPIHYPPTQPLPPDVSDYFLVVVAAPSS